jgi:FixJ family two-component response regulator
VATDRDGDTLGRTSSLIAIVDDDASLRRSVKNLLASLGFQAEAFASAEAFLESGQRENTRCMVVDLRMDGMSGLELLRHLAASAARVPVIVLTAHGDDAAREQCLQAGAVAFLEKPFRSDTLVEAIRRSLSPNGSAP